MKELFGKTVMVMKWNKEIREYEDDFEGRFLAFGVQGEYSDNASLCYTSGIIIDRKSNLHNVAIEMVRFTCEV